MTNDTSGPRTGSRRPEPLRPQRRRPGRQRLTRRERRGWAALTVLAALCGATPSQASSAHPVPAEQRTAPDTVRVILHERIAREGGVGLVAGHVTDAGTELHAAGRRAAAGPGPVDGRTVFEVGSLSKVFTGMLLADMAVRGEVGLEDPVASHLPDSVRVPTFDGAAITLLDLATHTSGLPRIPDNLPFTDLNDPYRGYEVPHLYAFLAGHELTRRPGSGFEYSNLGMGLLGHALAHRGGASYETLVRERILEPLGMEDTRITLNPSMEGRRASGHSPDLEPVPNWNMGVLAPAGGWHSTGQDLLRFLEALLDPPVGRWAEVAALAMEPRREAGGAGLRIGLGWHMLEGNGNRVVWHNGITGGYYAFVGLDPTATRGSVVLSNAQLGIEDIGFHLVDGDAPIRHPPDPRAAISLEEEVLEEYVGRYQVSGEFVIEVVREGEELYVQATDQPRFRTRASSPTRFQVPAVEAEIEFTLDPTGSVTGLVLHQGGAATPARRID